MNEDDEEIGDMQPGSYWDKLGVTQCRLCEAHLFPGTFFHFCGDGHLSRVDRVLTKTGILEIREAVAGLYTIKCTHFKQEDD